MTRKDYVAIAEILNAYQLFIEEDTMKDLVSDFQTFFKRDNSNFDKTRFENAVMK
tara:strand:+ start:115 stop:279 length:165 start_codon:yes stop_codon:yes gene_type:complete